MEIGLEIIISSIFEYKHCFFARFILSEGHGQMEIILLHCHNPKQFKTTLVGVVLLSVWKPHQSTTTTTTQPRKLMFGMQPYLNLTR